MRIFSSILSFVAVISFVFPTFGQTTDQWQLEANTEKELVVTPALLDNANPNHVLYNSFAEKDSHNAATYYYRAALRWAALPKTHRAKLFEKRATWLEGPVSELPAEEVQLWLASTKPVLKELNKAFTGDCDWGLADNRKLTYREEFSLDLWPEKAVFYEFGIILNLSARLHLARGEFDQAVSMLTNSITFSQHVRKLPGDTTFMSYTIFADVLRSVDEASTLPESPNLFSALQAIPPSFESFRPWVESEFLKIKRSFRFLDDPENADLSDEQWRVAFLEALEMHDIFYGVQNSDGRYREQDLAATRSQRLGVLFAKLYPTAKVELLKAGWAREKLDSMPVGQVIAIQSRRLWDQHNVLFRGFQNLPGPDANVRALKMEESDFLFGRILGAFPCEIMGANMSGLIGREGQTVAVCSNIQLLRDWLAKHGKFPDRDEFLKLKTPADPASGKPFEYRLLKNGDAQFQTPPDSDGWVYYRITLKMK